MSKFKVLIAGRRGQVAQALANSAPASCFEVVALGRPHLDLTNPSAVEAVVRDVSPDLVVNAAAYTLVDRAESDEAAAHELNATGAGQLSYAAALVGAPILHFSTDYVFSGDKKSPYVESDPVGPAGAYGRSKLAGELLVAKGNPRHVILRTAWVYSPWGNNFAKTMLRHAEVRPELSVVDDQIGNPTSARDIAEGVWHVASQIVETPSMLVPGIYHMTSTGEASWAEFAEEIFQVSALLGGPTARVRRISSAEYQTPTRRPSNSRLDCTRLRERFGLFLPHWRASTRQCVEELIRTKGWRE